MYRGLRVAVVIPAHNEERLLPTTLAGLPDLVDYVVVVDDASDDGTSQVARQSGLWELELIRHPKNLGVGGAIVTGYRHALAAKVDAVVVVGADAQMDPTEMSALLDPLVDGEADYVKGNRLAHPEVARRMPWVRLLGNLVLTRLTRWCTGYHGISDSQCGYTALAYATLAQLPLDTLYPRYGFPNDLLAKLASIDARVVDRPVSPIYGDERSGIRVLRVIPPILWLLGRAAWSRLRRARRGRAPATVPAR